MPLAETIILPIQTVIEKQTVKTLEPKDFFRVGELQIERLAPAAVSISDSAEIKIKKIDDFFR